MGGGKINNLKKVGKNFLSQLLCISAIFATASCNDDQVFNQTDTTPLQVSVNAQGTQSSRAIIHGEYLPDGSSIGISLFNASDGEDYDNQGYFNVKYTASGEGESQSWAAQGTTPSISANEAFLAAYYPYNPDVETVADLIAFPVENQSQTDYMYAGIVEGITNANPKVNITMQHALTAICVNLVLGDYTGDAGVSGIAVKSPALGSAATLNIESGELGNISGQGDEFALTTEFDLIPVGTATDVLFVPDASVTEGSTTVSATIGGKKYTAAINFDEAYLQGYIYTYTLTLNNAGFQLTKVNVTPWEPGNDDSATLEPEKDNTYIVKIVALYNEVIEGSYIEGENVSFNNNIPTVQSRSADTFVFYHNIVGFVGTIDWGDGTTDTYTEATGLPSHYYPNNGQEYTITAKGTMSKLNVGNRAFKQCLKEIIHIGDCGITSMDYAFEGCFQLQMIPKGLFDKCTEVTSFRETFCECINLQTIPEGLFDKCTEATSFNGTFKYCTSLQDIPEGLFDHNTKVTSFYYCFSGTAITELPVGLFGSCTEVTNFSGAFVDCSNLTGESPYTIIKINGEDVKIHLYERSNYPEYFTAPTSYSGCYYGCTGLTDYSSIPSNWK